jgi:NAD(P)-dependent dehydrogenase (short-subunit alcohol dehydrogenase family)
MAEKVAFITGGNRGLGFETARQLGAAGVEVIIGSRDQSSGEQALQKLRAEGYEADMIVFDVTKPVDHRLAEMYFGSHFDRLDILVNNAGAAAEPFSSKLPANSAAEVPMETLHNIFSTNFFGVVMMTKRLLPLIRHSPAGRIVNVASILGSLTLHSDPSSGIYNSKSFAYDASKTALNAYTVHLAYDLRDTKIKVNSAHPGWVRTALGGTEAPLDVAEGAKTAVQLALLPDDGPTGGFFHQGKPLPW